MLSLEVGYKYLLPRSQHETFIQLSGKLKDIFTVQLFADQDIYKDIVILALDILIQSNRLKKENFLEKRERFFIEFLSRIDGKTKDTLEKVLSIAQKGFLDVFLDNVDSKKKQYRNPKEIVEIVNNFHLMILPTLKRIEGDKESILPNSVILPSSTLQQTFQKVMECRTYFALPKLAKEFLSLLREDQKWNQGTYEYFDQLLNVEYNLKFDDFEKRKLYEAIFCLHSPLRSIPFGHCSEVDSKEFVSLCYQLKCKAGEEVLDYYFATFRQSGNHSIDDMIRTLNLLLLRNNSPGFYAFINQSVLSNHNWEQLLELLETQLAHTGVDESYFQENIDLILARFKNDPTIKEPLSDADLGLIRAQYLSINGFCREFSHLGFNQLMNLAHSIRKKAKNGPIEEKERLKLVAIVRLAIRLEFGIYPYSTQILTLLGLILRQESRQAQALTGEGKSLTIALWIFVMAMECRAGDIISSARYLAIRDQCKVANFFQRCGITTGHICVDNKQPKHFEPQILFGTAFDFQFAWMEDLLYGSKLYQQRLKNPFVSRNFDAVCVDESDNLLIDGVRNGARLAFPSDESNDWVYAPLLSFVRENKILVTSRLKEALLLLREYLNLHVIEQNREACSQLSNKQLKTWMKSALEALNKDEKKSYIVKSVKNEEGVTRSIQIVDIKTGRISENSRWSDGIHEFLEIKHDIGVAKESLNAITLTHPVFYRFYKTLSALTGTAERYQTKEIYHLKSFDVPPHLPLKRVDHPPIITENYEAYLQLIVRKTREFIQLGRPGLLLCETIQETELLAERMTVEGINYKLLNEIQEELEHVILSRAGVPGSVTIATNNAGRGTDIILTPESIQNLGLEVLLLFFPESEREERQAIGRAGRQGQPGFSQIILNKEDPKIQDLIRSQERVLRNEEIIALLYKQRELKEKSLGSLNLAFADLERFLAEKTHLFFESFRYWADYVEQNSVLEKFAQKLSPIKLNRNKVFNFEDLDKADLTIAEDCKRLLTGQSEILGWKVFLQKAVERLKKKMIYDWVKNFFQPIESQLMQTTLQLNALKTRMQEFITSQRMEAANQNEQNSSGFFAELFFTQMEEQIAAKKTEIDEQFENYRSKWEKYIAANGLGLFVYLKEITTIDLQPVITR